MAKVTIFGFAGTGKGSTCKVIKQRLGYEVVSNGDFSRMQAKEMGISIHEKDQLERTTDKYDKMRDQMVEEYGKTHDNFVAEGRLCWHFIPDSVKVKLECNFEERVRRVAQRDHIDIPTARTHTIEREEAIKERFASYYGIEDMSADSHFDLIIDTTSISVEEVAHKIEEYLREHNHI